MAGTRLAVYPTAFAKRAASFPLKDPLYRTYPRTPATRIGVLPGYKVLFQHSCGGLEVLIGIDG